MKQQHTDDDSPWFKKYQPKVFSDLVLPKDKVIPNISNFYENGLVKGNIICYGGSGLGKTSLIDVLINRIAKDPNDILALGKTVEDIRKLERWLLQRAVGSKQKIVKIEEMDKLSQQAQQMLKDGLMEKYVPNVAFLATTNCIDKIDPAVKDRFNTQLHFEDLPSQDVVDRLKFILDSEGIEFSIEDLELYVKKHPNAGMRYMVNNMESEPFIREHSSKVQSPQTVPTYTVIPSPWVAKMRPQLAVQSKPTNMLNIKQVLTYFGLAPNNPKRFDILGQLTVYRNPHNVNNKYREDEVALLINQLAPLNKDSK